MNEQEKRQLDMDGYLILEGLMDTDLLAQARRRVEQLFDQEGDRAGSEFKLEPQSRRLANLVDKGEIFRELIVMPEILGLVGEVLRPRFKLSSFNARSADPHSDSLQPLHCDMGGIPDEGSSGKRKN